jgi:Glycosyltransferase family 87
MYIPMTRTRQLVIWFPIAGLALLFIYELRDFVSYDIRTLQSVRYLTGYGDFNIYLEAARRFVSDPHSLYVQRSMLTFSGYIYPPLGVLLFVPFTFLNETIAYFLFQLINLGSAVLASLLILAVHRGTTDRPVHWPVAASFIMLVVTSSAVFYNFTAAQVQLLVIVLCSGGIYLGWRRFPILAGYV